MSPIWTLTPLIVKYLMAAVVTGLVLPAVAAVTFGQALWVALAITLIAYVVGDVLVLPSAGEPTAVLVDFVLATLIVWGSPLVMAVAVGLGPALVTGGAFAVTDILFHVYLAHRGLRA